MFEKKISDLNVLLVEPSHTQSKIITQELEHAGIVNISHVTYGYSALEEMHEYAPDLVISSMYFEDMTGSDLVHEIRNDANLHEIAFMLISSEHGFDALDPVRQAGVTAILPKPFESHQLKRGLFNTLNMMNPEELVLDDLHADELKVLIVDDSELARNHIKRVLGGLGITQFTEADDGAAAVPLLDAGYFDFVVTDYHMPKMDGKAFLEYIRSNSSQRSIPVLMVTSEENDNTLAAIEQAGVSGICNKPFETDVVKDMICNLLSDI
jgi:two-component system chemotaxis response regulator CheY